MWKLLGCRVPATIYLTLVRGDTMLEIGLDVSLLRTGLNQ